MMALLWQNIIYTIIGAPIVLGIFFGGAYLLVWLVDTWRKFFHYE